MNVEWSESAVRHLQGIHDYITTDSKQYALRMVDRITRTSVGIAALPEAGHIVPEYDSPSVREVIHSPYRIIYSVGAERITILAVIHAARLLPDDVRLI